MINNLSLRHSLPLAIIAMGVLSIVLAIYVAQSYRSLTIKNQQLAYEEIIQLRTSDLLKSLIKNSRELGQLIQNSAEFRRNMREKNRDAVEKYLRNQFHQYFVTTGIIRLNSLLAYDPEFQLISRVIEEKDETQNIGGVTCPALLQRIKSRSKTERLKWVSELCLDNGYPLMHVLIPIGGLKLLGYLEIVAHPAHHLIQLEKELGLPLKIGLPDGKTIYQSTKWPSQDQALQYVFADHVHYDEAGLALLRLTIVRDNNEFENQLRNTRNASLLTASLITLALATLMLFIINKTILNPLFALGLQLRSITNNRHLLGKTIKTYGNKEVQELAKGFNLMTRQLKALYDELHFANDELKAEVHEREQAQVQLKNHRDHLEELVSTRTADLAIARDCALSASQAKSRFLANMSHELRTPLNAIIGYSEMFLESDIVVKDEELAEDTTRILSAGKHLLTIINDVLDISKIEAGKMELDLTDFSVQELLEKTGVTVMPSIESNNNQLTVECAEDVGYMYSDSTKLQQVILNLLSNAAKFTHNGKIQLKAKRTNHNGIDKVAFSVQDTGIGLNNEQISNVFTAFNQADVSTTRKYGGTGLGLAICRNFCHMMGGDISANSTPGEGSVFTAEIPAKFTPQSSLAEGSESSPTGVKPEQVRLTRQPNDQLLERRQHVSTILLIDDDDTTQLMAQNILVNKGYHVICTQSGEEGVEIARRQKPDVIILDLLLSGMDGWSVLTKLKQDPALQAIPVIIMSIMEDKNIGYAIGAVDFLPKPVDNSRLFGLVNKIVRNPNNAPILVLEEDRQVRANIIHMLADGTRHFKEARNSSEAIGIIEQERPSLIIHDLLTSGMDGYEFLAELRKHPQWRTIPHITLASANIIEADQQRLQQSVNKVLNRAQQPSSKAMEEIITALEQCIGGS